MYKPIDQIEERVARTERAARKLLRTNMKTDIFFIASGDPNQTYIELHTRTTLKDMLPDQRADLLHNLLTSYDPGLDSPEYEAYQNACEIILRRVDHTRQEREDD